MLAMGEDTLVEQIEESFVSNMPLPPARVLSMTTSLFSSLKKPLENYRDIDAFKIYVSDLGLLLAKKDSARRKADTH